MMQRLCLWVVVLAVAPDCTKEQTRPADAAPSADVPPPPALLSPLPRFARPATALPAAPAAPVDAGSPPPMECGAEPCCGDPPQPCGSWLAEQRTRNGALVIEQVPTAECTVFLDGEPWPEGRTFRAFKFVAPGTHTVECRSSSGVLFSRTAEVELGRDTPVYWGP
jgi:hypothetical protein